MKSNARSRRRGILAYRGNSPAGREIISALADLHRTLKSGAPLARHYTVTEYELAPTDPHRRAKGLDIQ